MKITIEENKVIINLDEFEFPKFEAMFDNLHDKKQACVEYRDFPGYNGETMITLLPMVGMADSRRLRPENFAKKLLFAWVFAGLHSVGRIFLAEYFDNRSESGKTR